MNSSTQNCLTSTRMDRCSTPMKQTWTYSSCSQSKQEVRGHFSMTKRLRGTLKWSSSNSTMTSKQERTKQLLSKPGNAMKVTLRKRNRRSCLKSGNTELTLSYAQTSRITLSSFFKEMLLLWSRDRLNLTFTSATITHTPLLVSQWTTAKVKRQLMNTSKTLKFNSGSLRKTLTFSFIMRSLFTLEWSGSMLSF